MVDQDAYVWEIVLFYEKMFSMVKCKFYQIYNNHYLQ